MSDVGAWLLAVCGLVVSGIGVFFVALRPPLLPEDRRYIAALQKPLDLMLPGLARWLKKVFWVMGGYMIATGILTIYVALSGVRDGSATAWVVAAAAGAASRLTGVGVRRIRSAPPQAAAIHGWPSSGMRAKLGCSLDPAD